MMYLGIVYVTFACSNFLVDKEVKNSLVNLNLLAPISQICLIKIDGNLLFGDSLIVAIGSSYSQIALCEMLSELPENFPPIVISFHVLDNVWDLQQKTKATIIWESWPSRRKNNCVYSILQDKIYVGAFFVIKKTNDGYQAVTFPGKELNGFSNQCDIFLASAANAAGRNLITVVLSGVGDDGKMGAQYVRSKGGYVISQNDARKMEMPISANGEFIPARNIIPSIFKILNSQRNLKLESQFTSISSFL